MLSLPSLPLLSFQCDSVPEYLLGFQLWGQRELFNDLLRMIIISHLKIYSSVLIIYITMEDLINRITNVK